MNYHKDFKYRYDLATHFFESSKRLFELKLWRECVSDAQLCVENALKAVLALFGPIEKNHEPEEHLKEIKDDSRAADIKEEIETLIECGEKLGLEEHIKSNYGDEEHYILPWDIFDQNSAQEALLIAQKAITTQNIIVDRRKL